MSTVRIRFKVSVCTTLGSYVPGEVADWDAVDAMRLIKAGYAELA